MIASRLQSGRRDEIHAGVYQVGVRPLDWKARLRAATLACGKDAVASHRAAALLFDLDGIDSAPIEVTVPYAQRPEPMGVIVHRTRRPITGRMVDAIPVAPVERVILDIAWSHPSLIVEQVYESAIRRRLTTSAGVAELVAEQGTFGVRGVGKLLRVLDARRVGPATGSPAESLLLRRMRDAGIEEPVCQHIVYLPDGTVAVIDFAWPPRLKGVEVDGLEAHASAQHLESDLNRQNLLFEVRWQLRRFSGRQIRNHPGQVVQSIARFLAA